MTTRLVNLLKRSVLIAPLAIGTVWAQTDGGLKLGPSDDSSGKLDLGAAPRAETSSSAADTGTAANAAGVERVRHGDWDVACSAQGQQCAMVQIGNDDKGTPVLEMVIRKLEEPLEVGERSAIAVLDVITPLGVVLPEGLSVKIDDGRPESAPFQVCTEQGCLVREPIDDDLVNRLKRGSSAQVSVIAINQGEVIAGISLSGFTKAYDSLSQ